MSVPSLKGICGGGEDQLHVRNFTCTPGSGISHVHASLWSPGTESSPCGPCSFLSCFPDRGCEFLVLPFCTYIEALSYACAYCACFFNTPETFFFLQKYHFWLMPTFSATQLGCKIRAGCIFFFSFLSMTKVQI